MRHDQGATQRRASLTSRRDDLDDGAPLDF